MPAESVDLILSWFRGLQALGEVVFADCNRASPLVGPRALSSVLIGRSALSLSRPRIFRARLIILTQEIHDTLPVASQGLSTSENGVFPGPNAL